MATKVNPSPASDPKETPSSVDDQVHDIFRRHFETHFHPVDFPKKRQRKPAKSLPEDEDNTLSEWSGISEGDEGVEIISIAKPDNDEDVDAARKYKSFMTSKPPNTVTASQSGMPVPARSKAKQSEEVNEQLNLKNDLALQRLLRESHLLDHSLALSPSGTNKLKAIDLRLQTLGAKSSVLTQENMPRRLRQGIVAKAKDREERRKREAKENGIILANVKKVKKGSSAKRERGIGGPGVGKFRGGTLRLSKSDLADIRGTKDGSFPFNRARRGRS